MKKAVLLICCALILCASGSLAAEKTTFIYYYPWYLTPEVDGKWFHWNANRHRPPEDLPSTFYPKLGAYSSNDSAVVDQHMKWIKQAKIDVVIYSWWGRGDPTDKTVQLVLDAAASNDLKVAFMIEIYKNRSPIKIYNDVRYINTQYGSHPAFFGWSEKQDTAAAMRLAECFFFTSQIIPNTICYG